MCLRWIFTVPGRIPRSCAISLFLKPCSTNSSTCCSRVVSSLRPCRSDREESRKTATSIQQVLELVEQGFKNKEIAQDLGIRPGTEDPPQAHLRKDGRARALRTRAE